MIDDDQLAFFFAAQEIGRRLGLSPGAAQAKLRERCASGDVRSWKEPYSMVGGQPQGEGPPVLIEPSEWKVREVDLAAEVDGCKNFVNVSKIDLESWLKQQTTLRNSNSARDTAIIKQLKNGLRPGKNIQWKVFCEQIRKARKANETERGFSDETIENVTKKLGKTLGRIG
jgi:hypothetical protein